MDGLVSNILVNELVINSNSNIVENQCIDLGMVANRLPDDILKKIYYDYLEIPILFSVFKTKLETNECRSIEYKGLARLIPFLLRKPALISYMRKQYYGFDAVYRSHVILGEKRCLLMNFENSFACSWLMYMYH
jgi:hypothetical protein